MGKQGPCCHCGVISTPLWRNGPPEKPVLCNACGSRWRTKGSLVNYTPLHARMDPDDYEDHRTARVKSISINKSKEVKLLKRKPIYDNMLVAPDYHQGFRKAFDEDMMSNRSSSGSAISNSESCAQFGWGDASEFTGPAQSNVWESMVPSKKRTCVNRPKQSSVEKLTKDLYTILHEQQSSYFSGSSEEDLLLESETPTFGHGSVLIRHPSSIARDEESEASSLSVENKLYSFTEAYSHSSSLNVCKDSNFSSRGTEKAKNLAQGIREKSSNEKMLILGSHSSSLCNVDLNDIINFEEFTEHFTVEEQQQLLKYLPPLDTGNLPYSLENMFDSPQFSENLASYQNLLKEGVFDLAHSGMKTDDCKTVKRLALGSLTKSHWVERYHTLQTLKSNTGGSVGTRGPSIAGPNTKRPRENKNPIFSESKILRSPKRVTMKSTQELSENDGSCFSPSTLFAMPHDGSSQMLDSLHFVDESSDQDLLLEVPSHSSFAEAVLLHPGLGFGHQASTSSSSYPRLV